MATSDKEQQSILVPQHKRMAAGAPITGQTLEGKGQSKSTGGALTQAKKK
jgi:hypothetical protein